MITAAVHVLDVFALSFVSFEDVFWLLLLLFNLVHTDGRAFHSLGTLRVRVVRSMAKMIIMMTVMGSMMMTMMNIMMMTFHPLCILLSESDDNDDDDDDDVDLFDPAYYPVVFQRSVHSRLHSVLKNTLLLLMMTMTMLTIMVMMMT